jgi:flavin reductase (DIM6/NTAB) family NADH-FMN oxidoreductase RutF
VTPDEAVGPLTEVADYPLYVVTVADREGDRSGCLAGFVTQSSIRPPRYLVCVSKVNHTYSVAERAAAMALHLLGQDQVDVATWFGEETGDVVDKFARSAWHPGPDGVPVLDRCAAWAAGTILRHTSAGDHEAFLLAPTTGGRGTESGLLTYRLLLRRAPQLRPGHPATL